MYCVPIVEIYIILSKIYKRLKLPQGRKVEVPKDEGA